MVMLLRDMRYAIRVLLRTPGFTAIAILSLALGIGANTAMFSLADAMLLRPLPVAAPGNVVTISEATPDVPIGTLGRVSYPDYIDLRNKSKTVEGLTASAYTPVGLAEKPDALPQLKLALTVSGNLFQAMGVEPVLGRGFSPDEDRVPGRDAVVVLEREAGKGGTVRLNYLVAGVTWRPEYKLRASKAKEDVQLDRTEGDGSPGDVELAGSSRHGPVPGVGGDG